MPQCATHPQHCVKKQTHKVTNYNLMIFFISETFRLYNIGLGPIIQSIVSLTSSLRDQLSKCFMTL